METDWAAEHLQTIRTLMERSAVYRRALAPIMCFAGCTGILSAIIGITSQIDTIRSFTGLWFWTAVVAISGAFAITRRQALKDREPFWSLPTRRVAEALCPSLIAGAFFSMLFQVIDLPHESVSLLAIAWILFYGCALHAAGFFMRRGIRLLGSFYILSSILFIIFYAKEKHGALNPNWIMGIFFGVFHLVYAAYLYFDEKRKNAA